MEVELWCAKTTEYSCTHLWNFSPSCQSWDSMQRAERWETLARRILGVILRKKSEKTNGQSHLVTGTKTRTESAMHETCSISHRHWDPKYVHCVCKSEEFPWKQFPGSGRRWKLEQCSWRCDWNIKRVDDGHKLQGKLHYTDKATLLWDKLSWPKIMGSIILSRSFPIIVWLIVDSCLQE